MFETYTYKEVHRLQVVHTLWQSTFIKLTPETNVQYQFKGVVTIIWKTLYIFKRWIQDRFAFSLTPITIFTSFSHSSHCPIWNSRKLVQWVHNYKLWRNFDSNTPHSSNRKSCIYNGSIVICDTKNHRLAMLGITKIYVTWI